MKLKKLTALFLTAALTLCFSACGNAQNGGEDTPNNQSEPNNNAEVFTETVTVNLQHADTGDMYRLTVSCEETITPDASGFFMAHDFGGGAIQLEQYIYSEPEEVFFDNAKVRHTELSGVDVIELTDVKEITVNGMLIKYISCTAERDGRRANETDFALHLDDMILTGFVDQYDAESFDFTAIMTAMLAEWQFEKV